MAITEMPVLRPDGTILTASGYDLSTRLIYAPAPGLQVPPIPQQPTQQAAAELCRFLMGELLGDFPFVGDADRANALGLLVTPIVRSAIRGQVPLALVDAPRAGTGKGLLSAMVAQIGTGRPAGMMSAPGNEEEWRKQITANLLAGATVILIDNLEGRLVSASLSRALTAAVWRDRILGCSQQPELP